EGPIALRGAHHAGLDGGKGVLDFLGVHVAMLKAVGGRVAFEMDVNPTAALRAVGGFQAGIAGGGVLASVRDGGIEVVPGSFGVMGMLASQPQECRTSDENKDGGEATNSIGHGEKLLRVNSVGHSVLLRGRGRRFTQRT